MIASASVYFKMGFGTSLQAIFGLIGLLTPVLMLLVIVGMFLSVASAYTKAEENREQIIEEDEEDDSEDDDEDDELEDEDENQQRVSDDVK